MNCKYSDHSDKISDLSETNQYHKRLHQKCVKMVNSNVTDKISDL